MHDLATSEPSLSRRTSQSLCLWCIAVHQFVPSVVLQLLGFYAALSSAPSSGMRPLGEAAWQTSCECMSGAMCAPCSTCAPVSLTTQLSLDTWMATRPFQTALSERLWQLLEESAMLWTAWSRERYSNLSYSRFTVVLHETHTHAHASAQ